jgi:regulator of protease activity HflC (stomatin/prohibitin superfamily)
LTDFLISGKKQSSILVSEAQKIESINVARGEAEATILRADAAAEALRKVGSVIQSDASGGKAAASLRVAEKWIEAFGKLAKEGNTLIIPADAGNPSGFIAQALSIFKSMTANAGSGAAGGSSPSG